MLLTHRFREQARSHRSVVIPQGRRNATGDWTPGNARQCRPVSGV